MNWPLFQTGYYGAGRDDARHDGFEVARQIRTIPALDLTEIVFLTAKGTQKDKQAGYANGAEYYLIKPFDNDIFVSTIQEIMAYG